MVNKIKKVSGIKIGVGPMTVASSRSQIGSTFYVNGEALAVFECVCGNISIGRINHVRHGRAASCGCERDRSISKRARTHGKSKTREYRIWAGMRKRCLNPKSQKFKYYGGRGIAVCERWESFKNFLADMGNSPTDRHSIERIDCNGNYCPENCKWATQCEQVNNSSANVRIVLFGKTLNASQWGIISGVSPQLICERIRRQKDPKWSVFALPSNANARKYRG